MARAAKSSQRTTTGPDAEMKHQVLIRAEYRCERCRFRVAVDLHHRDSRKSGGSRRVSWINSPSNLVALCRTCHMWIEKEGRETNSAYRDGWLVKRWLSTQLGGSARVPVIDLRGVAWILHDDGTKARFSIDDYDPEVSRLLTDERDDTT